MDDNQLMRLLEALGTDENAKYIAYAIKFTSRESRITIPDGLTRWADTYLREGPRAEPAWRPTRSYLERLEAAENLALQRQQESWDALVKFCPDVAEAEREASRAVYELFEASHQYVEGQDAAARRLRSREMHNARQKRYMARKRGETVPKRPPGRPRFW